MLLVAKFGGTSLSCASQFEKVKNIVKSDVNRRVVVVSALGKRQPTDNKLTDLFFSVFENRSQSTYYNELWQEIVNRFVTVKNELNLNYDIKAELQQIQDGLAARNLTLDYLVSRGEYLTARLMAEYLDYEFFDAKDLIIFDALGEVDLVASYDRIKSIITSDQKAIIPGFYGADEFGDIKLFSRGGSDITGSIIAAGLGADQYENFTDVSGVLMADPRIVEDPLPIPELTYDEMQAIAYMGAEVLHRKSVAPVKQSGIPIQIKNTNDPLAAGTLINCTSTKTDQLIGFFAKKDYTFLIFDTGRPAADISQFFAGYNIKIENYVLGENNVEMLVSTADIKYRFEQVVEELKLKLGVGTVKAKEGFSIVKIFGRGIIDEPTFLETEYLLLEDGTIVVATPDCEKTIQALYDNLVLRS